MPLDPHLSAVLQALVANGRKPLHECTVQEARDGYRALTYGTRTQDQTVPVGRVEDTVVDGASHPLNARIYWPEGIGPFPTVIFFHGGGFVVGDLDTHDNMCRELCRGSQAVVVAVEYRLAPEHPFPAAVEDALAATHWVFDRAEELGGNARIAVAGDSAGGSLSAVVAQQLRAEGKSLAAQLLIYPALDAPDANYRSVDENATGFFLERATINWFAARYLTSEAQSHDPRLFPMRAASLAGLPPAVIVTAEFDPLRDEGEAYAEALRVAGVDAEVIRCDGMIHAFFDMGRWSPAAQTFIQKSIRKFRDVLYRP